MAHGSSSFAVLAENGPARAGRLTTPHGSVETPVFMPVGTRGSVKGLLPVQLEHAGTGMVLANTYHLLLRPGPEVVAQLGGLHRFMAWDGPILTDSGGFQVFSLGDLRRLGEDEVEFISHIDGARVRLGPESATRAQNQLGADVIMAFDECVKLPAAPERVAQAVDRTLRWARQSLAAHERPDQWMFGIIQGGTDRQLRRRCTQELLAMDFPGYAIGGLSVGEGHEAMVETLGYTAGWLPQDRPRYLMGVGTPRDLVEAIGLGVDMFDCVMPTRNGRNATAFVGHGRIKLRNERFKRDDRPLEPGCQCYACQRFSRGFLRHMFMVGEMAGPILVSLHNVFYYQRLMRAAREAIAAGRYESWALQWRAPMAREEGA